jgi:hypothetical protein
MPVAHCQHCAIVELNEKAITGIRINSDLRNGLEKLRKVNLDFIVIVLMIQKDAEETYPVISSLKIYHFSVIEK